MSDKIKILIVEDESIVAADLRNILQKKLGYEVAGVIRSGEEAVEAARNLNPDLILMDIVLYGRMTGIEAASIIKDKYKIPVVYLTAFSDRETLENAKATEPYGYVLKPLEERVLHSTIEMALYKSRTEKIIDESKERYRLLIENSPIAIGIHCRGEFVYLNPAGIRLFGALSAKDVIGKPVSEFILGKPEDRASLSVIDLKSKGLSLEGITERLRRIDGKVIEIETAAIPTIINDNPAVEVVICDITERRRQERIQRSLFKLLNVLNTGTSSESFYQNFYEAVKEILPLDGFFIAQYDKKFGSTTYHYINDEQTDKELISLMLNHSIERGEALLLDFPAVSQIAGKSLNIGPAFQWISAISVLVNGNLIIIGGINSRTYFHLGIEEKEHFQLLVDSLGKAVSEQIENESKSRLFTELEEINNTKDKFFSSLSHELKNSFNSLLGYTEVLKNSYQELMQDEVTASIDSLYESSRKIYTIIERLLKFSKYYSGTYTPVLKYMNFNELIGSELIGIRNFAIKRDVTFDYTVQDNVFVFSDEELITSILQNLIMQSLKYSSSGNHMQMNARQQDEFVEIEVTDKGEGIEEYLLKNLFITKDKPDNGGGHGLGFLLTRDMVRKCGGDLDIQSKPGYGSSFRLKLPAVQY